MTVASSVAVLFFKKIHPTFRSALDGTDTGIRSATYRYKFWNRTALLGSNTGNGIMFEKNESYDVVTSTGHMNRRLVFIKKTKK
jgi:hypothetical protein